MQDSVAYESYPTHPLAARDSWPATGPIYGIADLEAEPAPSRTIWQRLVANVTDTPEDMTTLPGSMPIWY